MEVPMLEVRRANERGHVKHGWLESFHTFSFASYHDPDHMGFRHLRVINEDRVQPGRGFDRHAHRDMEIVTYVIEGALEHEDSLGNGSVIRPGDVQRMSAGTGITHSEYNQSSTETVHFLQIWILPERQRIEPSYEQKHFTQAERSGGLRLVASGDGREGSVRLNQDARIHAGILAPGDTVSHALPPSRHAWVQVVRGTISVNGIRLAAGDGAALSDEAAITLSAETASEVLLFALS
jgi:redox-sensitive bicupin YhaK (pirin superfamily)